MERRCALSSSAHDEHHYAFHPRIKSYVNRRNPESGQNQGIFTEAGVVIVDQDGNWYPNKETRLASQAMSEREYRRKVPLPEFTIRQPGLDMLYNPNRSLAVLIALLLRFANSNRAASR